MVCFLYSYSRSSPLHMSKTVVLCYSIGYYICPATYLWRRIIALIFCRQIIMAQEWQSFLVGGLCRLTHDWALLCLLPAGSIAMKITIGPLACDVFVSAVPFACVRVSTFT